MNLLFDPIFRVQTNQDQLVLCLPALLERLGKKEIDHFVGLQKHQHDAFHVFLCYLAGAILARYGCQNLIQDEEFWRNGLLELAGMNGKDAWELIVEDISRPAFMQPPIPDINPRSSSVFTTPDELDVLQTAKNHDVKRTRAANSPIDVWVYALVSLQTMSGFLGKGNQGISRMNSGFGNRAIVELIRDQQPGQRWIDAVSRLLEHRNRLLSGPFGYNPNGLVLVWLEPWDGKTSLELTVLDPFYVEICRRIRLSRGSATISAHSYPAETPRIAAKELSGVVGDPWLPIDLKDVGSGKQGVAKALTFPPVGITAEYMRRIIFEEKIELSVLQKPQSNWHGNYLFSVSVLIRGQGTTDGFYEWEVEIPEQKARSIFQRTKERDELISLSQEAINYVATMRDRVLKPSVLAFLLGAPDRLRFDRKFANDVWTGLSRRFETLWSVDYFPWLFSIPDGFNEQDELRKWTSILQKHALTVLEEAEGALPVRSGRKYKIQNQIRSRFWGSFYANFTFMRRDNHEFSAQS